MESKFKVGDRVRVLATIIDDSLADEYYEGTIVKVNSKHIISEYGIRFDKDIGGHTLDSNVRKGHGWWCMESNMELIETLPEETDWRTQRYNYYDKMGWL